MRYVRDESTKYLYRDRAINLHTSAELVACLSDRGDILGYWIYENFRFEYCVNWMPVG